MTPNIQFLINCCKNEPTGSDIKQLQLHIKELDSQQLSEMVSLAHAHGVFPLVYHAIQAHAANLLSEQSLAELKQHNMNIVMQNMKMTAELVRIMGLLEENGIEALAFKGPSLSQLAYGDITKRQYCDLDILVDEDNILSAGNCLSQNGFDPAFPLKILQNKTCLSVTNDLGFYNKNNNLLIELHWKLFREKIARHLKFEQFYNDKQSIELNNNSISTLSSETLLVYLCLHGSKHAWERIEWICDIDKLIRSVENFDWKAASIIAEQMDTKTTFYLGLKLGQILFQTPLPEDIKKCISTDRVNKLCNQTIDMLNNNFIFDEGYLKYKTIHIYQMDLLETRLKKLNHLATTYFGISRNDCQSFPLPPALKFLYLFIKPFRVAVKYLSFGK